MARQKLNSVDWYRSSDGLPPLNVAVWVQWSGREFIAKRRPNPRRNNLIQWMVETSEGLIVFPPKKLASRMGEHPLLWRPIDPRRWVYMLPEPVAAQPDVDWFSELDETPAASPGDTWWEDETQVPRSPAGSVSMKEAEARALRALRTMRSISFRGPVQKSNADVLARISAAPLSLLLEDVADLRHDWRPKFEPSPRDLDDFLTASRWFEALNPLEMRKGRSGRFSRAQMALVLRSADPPWTWASIGDKWGVSGERARQIYKSSVEKVWRAANGMPVYKHLSQNAKPSRNIQREPHVHLD